MRRKRKTSPSTNTSASEATNALHSIDMLLVEIQARRLILVEDDPGHVEIWSPNCKLPISLHRGVYKFRAELATRLQSYDVQLCPSPQLHRRYHNRASGMCEMCRQLGTGLAS